MFYIYFICLLLFFCWFFTRNTFFIKSGLGAKLLVSLFLIRIIVAIIGFYYDLQFNPGSDSMRYQQYGIEEFQLLFSDPKRYLTNLFIDGYGNNYSGFFATENSYWNNLGANVIIKLLSLFNLISFENYLINTLLFNVFIFTGSIALYRSFSSFLPEAKYPLIVAIFLLPSAVLFSSYPHKDGMILLLISFIIYELNKGFQNKLTIKRILLVTLFLLLILFTRLFVFVALLPALSAIIIIKATKVNPLPTYLITYLIFSVLFFLSTTFSSKISLPEIVSKRQAAFINISNNAQSTLESQTLEPTFTSFLQNAPEALNHILMRPYIFELNKLIYLPFALEILLFQILFLIFLFFRKKIPSPVPPFIYFSLFFSVTILLIIGYTIPILGAFVRYRSIYFIFVMLPILAYTDWNRVHKKLSFYFKKSHNKS